MIKYAEEMLKHFRPKLQVNSFFIQFSDRETFPEHDIVYYIVRDLLNDLKPIDYIS